MQHTRGKSFSRPAGEGLLVKPQSSLERFQLRASMIYEKLILFPGFSAHALIRAYQLMLSPFIGRACRHLPTCSAFMDDAVARYGLWAGGWMGFARICRCHPWGTAGFDPVPIALPDGAHWSRPWLYGRWRGPLICDLCDRALPSKEEAR